MSQAPWATEVAGYQTWKQLGRHVRAGEKGIAILAPCRYRTSGDEPGGDEPGGDVPGAERQGKPLPMVVRGFKVVHVFDRSQTDGPPLPEPARPALLTGEAPAGMWDALVAHLADAGYHVERGDCGSANGRTNFSEQVVTVRADVDDAQAVKTLCHETGHTELHDGSEYAGGCRGRAEVEAESVAYLVCQHQGLTTDGYSFAYVAGWTGGDLDVLRTTAERVLAAARRIIADLDNTAKHAAPALAGADSAP